MRQCTSRRICVSLGVEAPGGTAARSGQKPCQIGKRVPGGAVSHSAAALLFFFSSRRRHTRLQGDWSSDVCSSDLLALVAAWLAEFGGRPLAEPPRIAWQSPARLSDAAPIEARADDLSTAGEPARSGERRVGEEGRSRWAPDHLKKKEKKTQRDQCQ